MLVEAIKQKRWREVPDLSARERALCTVAEKLSATPTKMVEEDWQPLRGLGFNDQACLEVAHVVGIFNYLIVPSSMSIVCSMIIFLTRSSSKEGSVNQQRNLARDRNSGGSSAVIFLLYTVASLVLSMLQCRSLWADESAILTHFRPYSQGTPRIPGSNLGSSSLTTMSTLPRKCYRQRFYN